MKLVFLFLLLSKHVCVLLDQLLFADLLHLELEANKVILLHLLFDFVFRELFLFHQLLLYLQSIANVDVGGLVFIRPLHEQHLPLFDPLELSLRSFIKVVEFDLATLALLVVAQDHSANDLLHFSILIIDLLLLEDFSSSLVCLFNLLCVTFWTIFNKTFKVLVQAVLILFSVCFINLLSYIIIFLIVRAKLSFVLKELLRKLCPCFLLLLAALLLLLQLDGGFSLLLENLISIDGINFRLLDWIVCL